MAGPVEYEKVDYDDVSKAQKWALLMAVVVVVAGGGVVVFFTIRKQDGWYGCHLQVNIYAPEVRPIKCLCTGGYQLPAPVLRGGGAGPLP